MVETSAYCRRRQLAGRHYVLTVKLLFVLKHISILRFQETWWIPEEDLSGFFKFA